MPLAVLTGDAIRLGVHGWYPLGPGASLAIVVALSLLAGLLELIQTRRRRRMLRALAARWQMTFSPHDRLRVGAKIVGRIPVPGAADVFVTDVIYGGEGNLYRYLFTAEYTVGAVRGKRRRVRVATFAEPRGRRSAEASHDAMVVLAPPGLPLVAQYERLRSGAASADSSPASTSESGPRQT